MTMIVGAEEDAIFPLEKKEGPNLLSEIEV